jgi:hypothetical protein
LNIDFGALGFSPFFLHCNSFFNGKHSAMGRRTARSGGPTDRE